MNCDDAKKIIPDHIEGNSPSGQQALIEEHLRSCAQCVLYTTELRETIKTLQGLDEIEPPAWLTTRVMKKIQEEASPRKRWIERLFFPLHIKLPLEAIATLLLTVAAIFIFKNMGPELKQMEITSQAPLMKSLPAEPKKESRKEKIQDKAGQKPQGLRKEARHKDNAAEVETREMTIRREEEPLKQPAPAAPTMPAASSSFAPSPALSSAKRHAETGKASGMAARDEVMQRAAPAAPRSELLFSEKKVEGLTTLTITVKAPDAAKREIEAYLSRNHGEMKIMEQSESRIILSIKLDPVETERFFTHLDSLGKIKEDRQALYLQSGLFKLIIHKQ